jgi:hypothetical protein
VRGLQGTRQKSSRNFGIRLGHSSVRLTLLDFCKGKMVSTVLLLSELLVGSTKEWPAAKVSLATVYQKHSSLRTRKRMYRG